MVDIKVAFTSQDVVPDPGLALGAARDLAWRLRIAHRPRVIGRRPNRFVPGFLPLPEEHELARDLKRLATLGFRQLPGGWYRLGNGPLEESPYYRFRVSLIERSVEAVDGELEARGLTLAVHPQMWTFELSFITMHLPDGPLGPFVGGVMGEGGDALPYSEIEERTSLAGPLAHMRLVEFLAALRREAIPSLTVRDPSGYLEHGDVPMLLSAMGVAGHDFGELFTALFPEEEMPPIQDGHQALPLLSGEVGSPERVAALERFLTRLGEPVPDIDDLLERGR